MDTIKGGGNPWERARGGFSENINNLSQQTPSLVLKIFFYTLADIKIVKPVLYLSSVAETDKMVKECKIPAVKIANQWKLGKRRC